MSDERAMKALRHELHESRDKEVVLRRRLKRAEHQRDVAHGEVIGLKGERDRRGIRGQPMTDNAARCGGRDSPVAAMSRQGCAYDPQTPRARKRRAEGRCGYCGHPEHWRLAGCDCGCPVIFEVTDPSVIERIAAEIAPDQAGSSPSSYPLDAPAEGK